MRRIFSCVFSTLTALLIPAVLCAQETQATSVLADGYMKFGLALSAGLAIGLAAFGGGLGQGKAAAAALEGVARNPEASNKIMTPLIISLALIESLVIYALVVAFILTGKI